MPSIWSLISAIALPSFAVAASLAAAQEKIVFSFGGKDGSHPASSLIVDSAGNLYGTTADGGAHGDGTVFELLPGTNGSWTEKVLYSFGASGADGKTPQGNLLLGGKGNLYGTTSLGGKCGDGTVFELIHEATGGWTENVLHSFNYSCGHTDGSTPMGGLIIDPAGYLYGTTAFGGFYFPPESRTSGDGTVFRLVPEGGGRWTEQVLYSFQYGADQTDGSEPEGSLVRDAKGNLYGTTAYGGGAPTAFLPTSNGAGTLFELSPARSGRYKESVYGFCAGDPNLIPYEGADGAYPSPDLVIDAQGNLYGTTTGVFSFETFQLYSTGTAFQVQAGGVGGDGALYVFGATETDADAPQTGLLLDPRGVFYGTTGHGGELGEGAAYELIPEGNTWTDKVLYSFGENSLDGSPSRLIMGPNGSLFGTMALGGVENKGAVFEIPAIPVAEPQFSPSPGKYHAKQKVKITDSTAKAAIYYTTNGDAPTIYSRKYTEPIEVSGTTTIKAIAFGPDDWQSGVAKGTYVIGSPATTEPPGVR